MTTFLQQKPSPSQHAGAREELEVWQLTHLEKTLASGSTEEGMGCSIKIIITIKNGDSCTDALRYDAQLILALFLVLSKGLAEVGVEEGWKFTLGALLEQAGVCDPG